MRLPADRPPVFLGDKFPNMHVMMWPGGGCATDVFLIMALVQVQSFEAGGRLVKTGVGLLKGRAALILLS